MPGKRYSQEEIDLIVKLKSEGQNWADISSAVQSKFGFKRSDRVLKIIFDRAKGIVPKARAKKVEAAVEVEEVKTV